MTTAGTVGALVLLILAMLVVGGLLHAGWWLAISGLRAERDGLHQQRQALDAEWTALDDTRRVREVFLVARRALQHEAQRQYRAGQPGDAPR